jgi:hypothetical protein
MRAIFNKRHIKELFRNPMVIWITYRSAATITDSQSVFKIKNPAPPRIFRQRDKTITLFFVGFANVHSVQRGVDRAYANGERALRTA